MSWQIQISKQARKDAKKLVSAGLWDKTRQLLATLAENPYQNPSSYEKLSGGLAGHYSRRINIQHRLVYEVREEVRTVRILRMWTYYE